MKITKKLLTLTSISLFVAISSVSVFFVYSSESNAKNSEVNDTLVSQNNILIASVQNQIENGNANLNLLRASFGLLLKEQALILNANLKNILAVNYKLEENEDGYVVYKKEDTKDGDSKEEAKSTASNEIKGEVNTTDMQAVSATVASTPDEIKQNSSANLDAINSDQDLSNNQIIKSKLIDFQKSIKQSGYDLMITHKKDIILETLDKNIMNAIIDNSLSDSIKKDKFFNSDLAKNFYTLKLKDEDKYHVAFVFRAENHYKFVFIKNITDVYKEFNKKSSTDFIVDTLVKKYNNLPYYIALIDKKDFSTIYTNEPSFKDRNFANEKDLLLKNSDVFEIVNNSENKKYYAVSSNEQLENYIIISFYNKSYLSDSVDLSLREIMIYSLIPLGLFIILISILYTQFSRIEKDVYDTISKDSEKLNKLTELKLFEEDKSLEIFESLNHKDLLRPLNNSLLNIYNSMSNHYKVLTNDITLNTIDNVKIEFSQNILKTLLPTQGSMPKSKFFDISGYIVPTKKVANTFYDMVRIDEDNLAFTIGYIKTKDALASIITMPVCINLIRSHLIQGMSLSSVYNLINEYLISEKDYKTKMSAFTLIVNEKTGNYLASSAGNLVPYCISDGKLSKLIDYTDKRLGDNANTNYNLFKGKLNYQESVVFLSNGLLATTNANNEKYGCQRIESYLINCYQKDPADILYDIYTDLMKFKGNTKQNNDICAMSIYRKPLGL